MSRERFQVLLLYPPFPDAFWSLPECRKILRRKALDAPLGLLTVAALLPNDWPVRLVDLNVRPVTEEAWDWADLVMISGMYPQRSGTLALVREASRRGKTTVVGGPYPTAIPQELLEAGSGIVVRGEAESTIDQLVEALRIGAKGVVIESPTWPDLTRSPIPRFDLMRPGDYRNLAIQTSRGCPHSCEFCDITKMFGRVPRHKTPEQVVAELSALYRVIGHGTVFLCDDNFIGVRNRAVAILQAITEWNRVHQEPFGFLTQTTVDLGQDLEMIDLLTAANFGQVFVGVESSDAEALLIAKKNQNLRHPVVESLKNICRNGLTVIPSFIVGLDGEKTGVDQRIAAIVEEAAVPVSMINLLMAPPGTQLWQRLEREGRLRKDCHPDGDFPRTMNLVPTRPEAEVVAEFTSTWDLLYEPSRFFDRTYRYFRAMRPTRAATARSRCERYDGTATTTPPWSDRLDDLWTFCLLVYRQGILSPCRIRFWTHLFGMIRHNPSRLVPYLSYCVLGEDMFRIRSLMQSEARPLSDKSPTKS